MFSGVFSCHSASKAAVCHHGVGHGQHGPQKMRELAQQLRKNILEKHVKGKGYTSISKQLDAFVTRIAFSEKDKVHEPPANLCGCDGNRKIDVKLKLQTVKYVK